MSRGFQPPGWIYWAIAVLLIAFGTLTGFSIGLPFLFLGLALVFLAPFRQREGIFVSALVAVVAFFVGFALVAPLGCTVAERVVVERSSHTGTPPPPQRGHTSCTNVIGVDYSGPGTYNPPLWPAALAGAVLATMAGGVASFFLRTRNSRQKLKPATVGWAGVTVHSAWTLFLAGLGLFSDGALDPQWRTALVFVCLAGLPAVLAIAGLRGRPVLLLTAGIISIPLSLLSLAGATLPLLLPAALYLMAYARS